MVSLNTVDDFPGFLVLLADVDSDLNVCSFDLVVDGLSDIVEESAPSRELRIKTEFLGPYKP